MTKVRMRLGVVSAGAVLAGVLVGLPTAAHAEAFPVFALPFQTGQQVYSAGIHSDDGNSGVKNAIDFSPYDKTVRAPLAGTVAIQHCSGGDWVTIDHGNGWRTGYYHMENIAVTDGQAVTAGTVLGKTGNALPCGGSSTGAHVHFTLWALQESASKLRADRVAAGNWSGMSYEQVSAEVAEAYGEPVDGKSFGGYRFTEGAEQYGGTATRLRDNAVTQLPGRFRLDR
ncbi:LasA protease [Amycolatopsis xylanica]|uniref:LasA protease n=1 Tax=Amycolatopsis xylanica TaxID=589385 RepID=A0A1H3GA57_9PSEU|nr:M23 family metallopeptidase [Amycolatopsis xylanica]SDX99528.1 LasA protease [Amycolatopsis xylanica]